MEQKVNEFEAAMDATQFDLQVLDQASVPFVGQWNQLVSNTNWEKGKIILQWREALQESGAPTAEYSDDAWSRRVGGVTGQHVGRLRRVYQRFGGAQADYPRLYWSHFQAAIEWDDAEMWLEGAVQNGWSVADMRRQRSETLGVLDGDAMVDTLGLDGEQDEDFEPADGEGSEREVSRSVSEVQSGPRSEGPDFGDQDAAGPGSWGSEPGPAPDANGADASDVAVDFVRPFAELAELPEDLSAAFEAFKLAILHHKLDAWQQIARADVLASLEALKQLTVAP